MTDSEIDFGDAPETTPEFWKTARVVLPKGKAPVSIRLDRDVIEWFKRTGRGYQTRMNAVLRSYVENQPAKPGARRTRARPEAKRRGR